jgi:hypothetical protein
MNDGSFANSISSSSSSKFSTLLFVGAMEMGVGLGTQALLQQHTLKHAKVKQTQKNNMINRS